MNNKPHTKWSTLLEQLKHRMLSGPAGNMLRGMITLAIGAGAARFIGIAAMPLLTRLYGPSDFGVLSVYTSLVLLLVPLFTLRYLVALPLPRSDGIAINLLILCFILITSMTSLVSIILWYWHSPILTFLSMESLIPYWWLIVLGTFGSAIYETLTMWATRKKSYGIIAKTQLTQSIIGESIKVILGLLALKPLGLLIGQIAGQSSGSGKCLSSFKGSFIQAKNYISPRRILFSALYYQSFPLYRLPAQILLALSMQAPMLLTAALFNSHITGQLGLAQMALTLPFVLLGQAMSRAFYGEISALGKNSATKISLLTRIVTIRMAALAAPIALILFLFGEPLFVFIFGNEWRQAGAAAGVMSLYLTVQFAATAPLQVGNVLGKQSFFLNIYLIRSIFVASVFFIAYWQQMNFIELIWLYTVAMSLYYISVLICIFQLLNKASNNAA